MFVPCQNHHVYIVTIIYVCTVLFSPHLRSIIFAYLVRGSDIFSCQKGILFSFEASRGTTKEGEKLREERFISLTTYVICISTDVRLRER